jgi:hypothetical protein
MMSAIKQVWITDHDSNLCALSIESNHVKEKHMRVKIYEAEFPEVPSVRHPLRHVVHVSLFSEDDLKKILTAICKHLKYEIQLD